MNKSQIEEIKKRAEELLPEQTDLLMRFCTVDSESDYVPGNRLVVDMAEEKLRKIDGIDIKETFYEGTGAHIVARITPPNANGKIVISSHMDTVFPVGYAEKFPPYIDEDNWLHGLGSGDCKAGFAVSAYAIMIAQQMGILPNKEIVMLYTCDEEIGSPTANKVFEQEAKGAECAYVFEAAIEQNGGYGIVTKRDGVVLGALDIKGVEAHAGGAYLKGHSAIKELAHKILKYYSFNDYDRGIFYNVAPISGGRPNGIVAGDAHMEFCVAGIPKNSDFPEVERNIDSLAEHNEDPVCQTTVEHHMLFPALERDERALKAVDLAVKAGDALGIHVEEAYDPTATDANWMYYYGIPAVDALGPVQRGMHTTEEKIYLPSMPQKTAMFAIMLGLMGEE